MSESVSDKELSKALAIQILNEYRYIEKTVNDVDSSSTAPWITDRLFDKLILKYSPNLHDATLLLRFCTIKSIKNNHEALIKYYCEALQLMEETAKTEIAKLTNEPESYKFDDDFKQKMFMTMWHAGEEKPINEAEADLLNKKDNYYCVYFSENHTPRDIEWFLEHNLNKTLKSDTVKTREKRRKLHGDKLIKKTIVGYLTILGMNGADSARICAEVLPEAISYDDIYHIRDTIKKNNWFNEANKEFSELISTERGSAIMTEYKNRVVEALQNNNYDYANENYKLLSIPKFLELNFSEQNNKFHLKMSSDL